MAFGSRPAGLPDGKLWAGRAVPLMISCGNCRRFGSMAAFGDYTHGFCRLPGRGHEFTVLTGGCCGEWASASHAGWSVVRDEALHEKEYEEGKLRTSRFALLEVDHFPEAPEPGVLYYAEKYRISLHLCACGCGHKAVCPVEPDPDVPLSRNRWWLFRGPDGPTLAPSVGNFQFPCGSHYFIRNGAVEWCR